MIKASVMKGLKEKLPFPKWSFLNLEVSSFLSNQVLSTCRSLRPDGVIGKISLKNFTNLLIFLRAGNLQLENCYYCF